MTDGTDPPAPVDGGRSATSAVDESIVDRIGETAFLRSLVDSTSDGILTIDESSVIVFANPAVERIFGHPPEELVGRSLLELIPEDRRDRHTESMRRYVETGERGLDWEGVELTGVHRDGHEIDLAVSFQELDGEGRPLFTGLVRDVTDRRARERELERYRTTLEAVGDAIYQLDLEGNFVAINDVVTEVTGYTRDELIGEPVSVLLDDEAIRRSMEVIGTLLTDDEADVGVVEFEVRAADGTVVPVEDRIALLRSNGEVTGTVGVVRDVSERKQRERELERQRNELAELNRINAVIREINRTLVGATTREEIEETVCARLAGAESYVFVWIGDPQRGDGTVRPTRWAGGDPGDSSLPPLADHRADGGPAERAFRTGDVAVARSGSGERDRPSSSGDADAGAFSSVAAVPLQYGDTIYGVVSVYSDRPHAFDERERAVLAELGETIGHAINAVESKKLLYADTIVELQFHVPDSESFFIAATGELACRLELEGVVPATESSYLFYVTLTGADPAELLALAEADPHVDDARVISEHDGESLFLFEVAWSSAVVTLIEAGTRVETAVARDGQAVLTAETAPDADTSAIVETVTRVFPGSELVARRERERPVQTEREFREVVKGHLTDRQRTVLEAAYRGGYFARPRDISGNDLADSFDLTPSTLHHHLQTGLNKVMAAVFDDP